MSSIGEYVLQKHFNINEIFWTNKNILNIEFSQNTKTAKLIYDESCANSTFETIILCSKWKKVFTAQW